MPDLDLATCEIDPGIKIFCAYDAYVRLSALRPHPQNPNQHPLEQLRLLWKLIGGAGEKSHGWRAAIVVSNRSGFVTKGHGRLLAARYGGMLGAPVHFQDYESEEQEIADLMADNMIQELSFMDKTIVDANIAELKKLNESFDLELLGKLPSPKELADSINQLTKGAAVEKKDQTGQYPIVAKLNEHYDYLVIITENETDQAFLRNLLGVRYERSAKQREIGIGRVRRFSDFMESIRANRDSLFQAGEQYNDTPPVE